ncbi:hypothetical protein ABZ636_03910 [Streptomyces sp. NPDC007251]|uniref:hypothetical protein n=1 Tax=Streptomyces sp. NPDC007251 TaxID=3154483 RepID=UPI0033CAFAEC
MLIAATVTACSSSGQPKTIRVTQTVTASPSTKASAHQFASAQAVADALQTHGFTVSMLHKDDGTYISDVGGSAYDFTVTDKAGKPAAGDAGINMFPNHEALASWTEMSKGLGGVAVTGDTWAVSLPTGSTAARADSKRLAPLVAKTLGGTVQQ